MEEKEKKLIPHAPNYFTIVLPISIFLISSCTTCIVTQGLLLGTSGAYSLPLT